MYNSLLSHNEQSIFKNIVLVVAVADPRMDLRGVKNN